jgi:hypothetical protein
MDPPEDNVTSRKQFVRAERTTSLQNEQHRRGAYNMEIPNESNPNESNQIFGRRALCRPLGPAGLVAQLLGGWQVNAIVTAQTGTANGVIYGNDTANTGWSSGTACLLSFA